jgi:uncharacterized protein (TIGR03382 family)
MRRALLGILLAGCVDGGETSTSQRPIVNGEIDHGDPAVVLLDLGGAICTGTVISPHVVLTAGHCITSQIDVWFDDGSSISSIEELEHSQIDMGLVALASPAPVTPIPHNRTELDGHFTETVRIVGFGVTSENGSDSGTKRMGTATLHSVNEPDEMWTTNDPQGTCYGDSGGPNFMNFGQGEVVAGVTTTGTSICGEGLDIATRPDRQLPWIDAFVEEHDADACGADGTCMPGCIPADPDCACADDGACTASCPDPDDDPDCEGCGAGDGCRADCPDPDPDCEAEPGPDAGDDDGEPSDDEPAADPDDDDVVTGGCSSTGGASLLLGLVLVIGVANLRHRRAVR